MKKLQPFRIDQGICQFDFNDYYAALGVPITADAVTLRKRYLSIAKILHPDIYGRPPLEKHLATQYLAKLVNPAYHVLNQPLERTAYTAVLKLLGKRLMKKGQRINPQSEVARQLLYFPSDFSYEKAILEVAEYQFQSLDTILEYSGQISELNLVYILYQEGYKHFSNSTPRTQGMGTPQSDNTFTSTDPPPTPPPPTPPTPPPPPIHPTYKSSNTGNIGNTNIYKAKNDIIYTPPSGGLTKSNKVNSQANTRLQPDSQINPEPPRPKVSIQPYIKLAEDYIAKSQWSMARNELTKAEQIDNSSSKCYALLGLVYMNQKLMGLAKTNFQKALRLNPQEPLALKYINSLDASGKKDDPKGKDKPKSKKGGFFGWLSGN